MRIHLYLLCIALLAACGDDDHNNDDKQRALDNGDSRGNDLSAQARSQFSGASDSDAIARAAAIVATIDTGEIDQANFVVSTIGSDDSGATAEHDRDVRDLAQQIITDHQANLAQLQNLLGQRGIAQADNPVAASLRGEAMTGLAQLKADSRSDLDMDYARMQVMMHQEAFVLVETLQDLVRDDAFRSFLSDTQDAIESHREHAGDVLNDL
jgi:predicted outer membrane protein